MVRFAIAFLLLFPVALRADEICGSDEREDLCDFCQTYAEAYELGLADDKPIVVFISSNKCPPCRVMLDKTRMVIRKHEVAYAVVTLEEASPEFVSKLTPSRATPQLIAFGRVKGQSTRQQLWNVGAATTEKLETFFKNVFNSHRE
jgi:glutaredoxin